MTTAIVSTVPVVRERGILFRGRMVRAIQDGSKTETRRIIGIDWEVEADESDLPLFVHRANKVHPCEYACGGVTVDWAGVVALGETPYGNAGDRLWVKEQHARIPNHSLATPHYFADGPLPTIAERHDAGLLRPYPSIFTPRWASRFTLDLIEIRVERLTRITEAGARNEGFESREAFRKYWNEMHGSPKPVRDKSRKIIAYRSFAFEGEDEIRTRRGMPWLLIANPWVWVVRFAKVALE